MQGKLKAKWLSLLSVLAVLLTSIGLVTLFNGDAEAGEPGQNEAVTITNITVKKLTGGVETDDVAYQVEPG